jgi:hypothetical protein
MKHSPKLAVLQSLDAMDPRQVEQVLLFIKGLSQNENRHRVFKSEAMKEIRKALRTEKRVSVHA